MVQSTEKLIHLVENEEIVDLVSQNTIQGASIDLRIGEFAKIRKDSEPLILSNNPNLDSIYEEISLAQGFRLKPNQYLYADTVEYVKIPKNMCGLILPRSTFARLGLILPISQYANPSYEGKLPIIIYNASPVEVEIPPYYKVMQILFLELDGKAKEYKEQIDVKYFKENNIPNPKLDSDYNIEDIISELK
jgi:dCTP deaminase